MEPEDRSDQFVLVEVSKKDVVPQEEVLEEGPDMEVIENLEPQCSRCGSRSIERRGMCGQCFFAYQQTNPNWRYEKDGG